ncbi:ADP-ribose pyrophosphatase YjhB, NUDIX family [Terribacillus halophilus]|uniref:ADP-ribose pyrophosphatase YjhB, NUDIX family n=1 Tax=Terribacillus halophilus TaxID=361279 RepID=A0A1G6T8K8_9BACI|nr:NUDIX domain-containing protein [Terribacillus halophilus]SDD25462.1 ADP-ribose pyrophosphatase YjhB, NUDIX family [Terribacillus halophilus]
MPDGWHYHKRLHKNKKDPFWTLIGGRVQLGEDSAQAWEREFEEELGIPARAERLLWIVENFFIFRNRPFHEYSFIYLMMDAENKLQATGEVTAFEDDNFLYEWISIDNIKALSLRPAFLKETLAALPSAPVHLIHKEKLTAVSERSRCRRDHLSS